VFDKNKYIDPVNTEAVFRSMYPQERCFWWWVF